MQGTPSILSVLVPAMRTVRQAVIVLRQMTDDPSTDKKLTRNLESLLNQSLGSAIFSEAALSFLPSEVFLDLRSRLVKGIEDQTVGRFFRRMRGTWRVFSVIFNLGIRAWMKSRNR